MVDFVREMSSKKFLSIANMNGLNICSTALYFRSIFNGQNLTYIGFRRMLITSIYLNLGIMTNIMSSTV